MEPSCCPPDVNQTVTCDTRLVVETDWLPAWRLHELLRSRVISPVELVAAALARIERLEPSLHALLTVVGEQALREAREAEAAIGRGELRGPLHGIPVVLKDDIWVEGIRCTAGSLLLEDFVAQENSVVAERLRAAGAIVLAKTNVPEFSSFYRTVNRLMPECRNPWDTTRTCGGSSGGPAAALAAGMVPAAIGTDGGGSIRLPAALCGVVGLLPTKGLVPGYGSFTWGHCTIGPMARDVRDVALLLQSIAGADARDPWALRTELPDYTAHLEDGVEGMRLALSPDLGSVEPREPRILDVVREAASALAGAGATIEETGAAAVGDLSGRAYRFARKGAAAHGEGPVLLRDSIPFRLLTDVPEKRAMLCPYDQESGGHIAPAWAMSYEEAIAAREQIQGQLGAIFKRHSALLTPTFGETAPPITDELVWPFPARYWTGYTDVANFCGLPALSVPAGLVDGLPVGLQIIGPAGSDDVVMRIGHALQTARPWHHPPLTQ
jgi:Asp-tRNA(Asn)/Glu-tRNA(Gln) amidotransferase A subunit family amidase